MPFAPVLASGVFTPQADSSFHVEPAGIRLAPHYDLVCIAIYHGIHLGRPAAWCEAELSMLLDTHVTLWALTEPLRLVTRDATVARYGDSILLV